VSSGRRQAADVRQLGEQLGTTLSCSCIDVWEMQLASDSWVNIGLCKQHLLMAASACCSCTIIQRLCWAPVKQSGKEAMLL
jgi:hypothetical protein